MEALLAEGGVALSSLRVRAAPYVDAAMSTVGSYGEAAAAQVREKKLRARALRPFSRSRPDPMQIKGNVCCGADERWGVERYGVCLPALMFAKHDAAL